MAIADLNFLVSEDNEFQRRLLVDILSGLGAPTVYEAVDGAAALAILVDSDLRVDMLISDLDMPGMDGMALLRHIGEEGIRIPIILASAIERKLMASVVTMSEAYGINLLGVIPKPLTPLKLERMIALHRSPQAHGARADALRRAPIPSFTLEQVLSGLENTEFEPYFQPKIALTTRRIEGIEALARWNHPEMGIVAPSAFIPRLEDNDLIDELSWIMLKKAAACCSRWRSEGLDATVSVNMSLKSLVDTDLADRVMDAVAGENLDPAYMVLELTETAVATDVGRALENLVRLRMRGFGLSIDDYGTGYSSMQQLTRIAFTELKIDQSFVINAAKQNSSRVILESSLEMAKRLSITSVAEGVETKSHWDLMCELGCDVAQGYYIARPMAYPALLDWTRTWQ